MMKMLIPVFVGALIASVRASSVTFPNPNTIIINDSTNPPTIATPYPSSIVVTGLTGQVLTKVTVGLFNISHAFPDDIDILLVGPQGQQAMIMSNVGGDTRNSVTNVTLILDDDASNYLPTDSPLVSGTFKPTKKLQTLTFSFPDPCPPGSATAPAPLAIFNGSDPNGTWRLFVVDDAYPDAGIISGGWNLTVTSEPLLLNIAQTQTKVVVSWTNTLAGFTLQTSPSLLPSAVWTNVTPQPAQVSGRWTVTNSTPDGSRFYRLIK